MPAQQMPSLTGATDWLNSPPLSTEDLRGRVVLVDFWTYTCINWLRTLPYRRAWADRYSDHGLVLIGVHTPEFSFERDIDNVRRAVADMDVTYPVAVDSDYAIWQAFDNHYWPALYLADAQGQIRHHHFGEGAYDRSETILRELLVDAGAANLGAGLVDVDPRGIEAEADWDDLLSPENYLGYARTENLSSRDGDVVGERHTYPRPDGLRLNQWAPSGEWTIGREAAASTDPGGRISYCFHARDLNLVMGPATRGQSVRFRVLVDGQPPGTAHGVDVDEQGNGSVSDQRLYQLVRQPEPAVADRRFDIEFLDPGVEAYVFTFG
jgi:thiol-disulfide isomerase/thioredoxin